MTVSSVIPVNNYTGNASATTFDFDFLIEKESELVVTHISNNGVSTVLKEGIDYSINEVGNKFGSFITFPLQGSTYNVLQPDEVISLALTLDIKQESEFQNSANLNLSILERTFDYIVRILQIMNRNISRAVKVTEGSGISPDKLINDIKESEQNSYHYLQTVIKKTDEASDSADLAKAWAVKTDGKVQNEDFSSKYYANKSEQFANIADVKAKEADEKYHEAIEDIQDECEDKIDEIKEEAEKQRKKIKALGFYQKDGKFYYIDEEGEETPLQFEKTDNIFDLVIKDHILSFKEKTGLEQLGEYVYKEAQDGRRGYPDFYDKCLEEYNDRNNKKEDIYFKSNILGDIINNKGIISGFSTTSFATINKNFFVNKNDSWEIVLKAKMPSVAAACAIIGSGAEKQIYGLSLRTTTANKLTLYVSGNSTSWNIASALASTNTFELDKEYLIKISYSLTGKEENQTATYRVDLSENIEVPAWINFITKEVASIKSTTAENTYKINSFTPTLGVDYNVAFSNGKIDLNKSYIKKGVEIFWQGTETVEVTINKNGHRFYDIKDKEKVDKIYQDTGVAWYYGIDEENERIFLPRNDFFFQNGKETGKFIEAGLPNITGSVTGQTKMEFASVSGAFQFSELRGGNTSGESPHMYRGFSFDASLSNNIYGNSNTVQPPSVCVAVYMVVGNTTVTRAQTDALQVTSSENDTLPLFTDVYFDFKPNHVSWLKAGTQASGNIYESAYNELVKIANGEETKYGEGFKVIKEADKLPYTDYSEYWIINEDEQTFKPPLKTSLLNTISNARILIEKKEPTEANPDWYNLYSDGWLEQGGKATNMKSNEQRTINLLKPYADTSYSVFHSTQITNQTDVWGYGNRIYNSTVNFFTIYINSSTSGNVAWKTQGYTTALTAQEIAKSENIGLYFKVANALEKKELIDCGEVLEELNNKVNLNQAASASMPSTKYINLELGASGTTYTAPANGWLLLAKTTTAANQYISVVNKTTRLGYSSFAVSGGYILRTSVPVKEGDTYEINYTVQGDTVQFRFVYAEGSK